MKKFLIILFVLIYVFISVSFVDQNRSRLKDEVLSQIDISEPEPERIDMVVYFRNGGKKTHTDAKPHKLEKDDKIQIGYPEVISRNNKALEESQKRRQYIAYEMYMSEKGW